MRIKPTRNLSRLQIAGIFILTNLFFVHLVIGSAWQPLMVLTTISLIGLWSLDSSRLNFSRAYICMLSAYSGLGALIIKAMLWQPLETNLIEPNQTSLLIAVGFASALVASKISTSTVQLQWNPMIEGSERLVLPLTVLGFIFQTLHIALRPQISNESLEQAEGFGGFGSLYFILLLGVALQYYWYGQNRSKHYLKLIVFTGVVFLIFSMLGNVKRLFLDFCFISVLSAAAFRIKFKWAKLASIGVVLGFMLAYLSPAIHLTRDSFQSNGLIERLTSVYEVLSENEFSLIKLNEAEELYFKKFAYSYRPNASYVFPSTINVDRFCLVLPLDQVVRAFEDDGKIGLNPFLSLGVRAALPSVLVSKEAFTGADLVGWRYGIRDSSSIARPVIGLTASAFSAWGAWGVILLPALVLLPIFFLLDRLPGRLAGNPLTVMLIALSANLAEQGIDGVMVFLVRQVPIALIVSILILRLGGKKSNNAPQLGPEFEDKRYRL